MSETIGKPDIYFLGIETPPRRSQFAEVLTMGRKIRLASEDIRVRKFLANRRSPLMERLIENTLRRNIAIEAIAINACVPIDGNCRKWPQPE